MRLLHVINSMVVGGAEVLLHDTITGIDKYYPGTKQYLITLFEEGPKVPQSVPSLVCLHLNKNRREILTIISKIRRFIIENKIEVVHAHLYEAMIICRISLPSKVKLVYTYHIGMHNPRMVYYSTLRKWVDRLTYRKKHRAIFVSNIVKEEVMMGVPFKDNGHVVYNFHSEKFKQDYAFNPSNALKLIAVGNFKEQKNFIFLIHAFEQLTGFPVELDIYGTGPLEDDLKNVILKTKVNIRLIKGQRMTSSLMSSYDAFIMASTTEGMSIALLEAIATGMPSVLSAIPSFIETAGNSGFFFKLENVNELVSLLKKIQENKILLKEKSEAAIAIAPLFSLQNYLGKIMSIYKE